MPDNAILARMLDRLYGSLTRGPSLNARPHNSRQRIDLTRLAAFEDGPAERALADLVSEQAAATIDARVPVPEGWSGRFRRGGAPGGSEAAGDAPTADHRQGAEGDAEAVANAAADAPSASDAPADEVAAARARREALRRYSEQHGLLTKLRNLSDDAKTYEQDTGVSVLAVGYPMLSLPPSALGAGSKRVLAPIAMLPLDLTVRTGSRAGVRLACREGGIDRVQPNTALLAWLERETQQPVPEDLFADESGEQPLVEIEALIAQVVRMLGLEDVDAAMLAQPDFAGLAPIPRADGLPEGPAILPGAVLGLFPSSNQGLLRDMRELIAQDELEGPIRSFVDSTASLAGAEHDTPEPERTAHREQRRFADERLVAMADPCQAETVRLAHREQGLVIHGPPGTGKSQTITNIIGDFLARGQRVLFVCDKRTALDVVHDRLDHMGLGRLCALIHDAQRDQRDLYMGIRARLEELTDIGTDERAEATVDRLDRELESIHGELTRVHEALLAERDGGPSFHELAGEWLAVDAPAVDGVEDALGDAIVPDALEAFRAEIEVVLGRAETVGLAGNPWADAVGLGLEAYLRREPDELRQSLGACAAQAAVVDASADERIPAFADETPLDEQVALRERLAGVLRWIDAGAGAASAERIAAWSAETVARRMQELAEVEPLAAVLREGPLERELWTLVRDAVPTMREIAGQLVDLGAFLDSHASWFGFLQFGVRGRGREVLRSYGLPGDVAAAERLRTFLGGLRARRVLTEALLAFEDDAEGVEGAVRDGAVLADDGLLERLDACEQLLPATVAADGQAQLAERWRLALADAGARGELVAGLDGSAARAAALVGMERACDGVGLFDGAWLASTYRDARAGAALRELFERLAASFDDVENVVRVRDGIADLPEALGRAVAALVEAAVGPDAGVAVLRRAVLGRRLRRLAADDASLAKLDPQRLERHIERVPELEADKREAVVGAILHGWIARQKARLLVGTGSRLNSDGASLRNRLFVRGKRAMRLRQVVSVGREIEGGDPLFEMCPVWLTSPETVAQVFPREALFDVVIFDEASQCRLEEALPVLTRGSRVVIAGDPKQLPPTRFFEAAVASSEDEPIEDEQDVFEAQLGEVEDLLGAALNLEVQESYLDVHYRSRNADLIGFSNEQFYHDRLQPIPGHPRNVSTLPPIRLHHADGVYEERANEPEARRVVDLVGELLAQDEPPSIGIATFNLVQRDLIAELLEERASEDADFARRLATARTRTSGASFEGLFVKNLENVQGDERDVIVISTTYGPNPEGRFHRRFGPLRQAGGGRRLNVLVTRAREHVHLVTSIPRAAYAGAEPLPEGETPNGAWLLFAYLRYAEVLETLYARDTADGAVEGRESGEEPDVLHRPIAPESRFALALAGHLARSERLGSEAHWGNEGFCIDMVLQDPAVPGAATVGVLADFNRFRYAADPVAWEVYRTAILRAQGWTLQRVWTPEFLRDRTRVVNALVAGHREVAAAEGGAEPGEVVPLPER